jgi:hypothetical protein
MRSCSTSIARASVAMTARAPHELCAVEERVADRQGSSLHLGVHPERNLVGRREIGKLLISAPQDFEYHSPPPL